MDVMVQQQSVSIETPIPTINSSDGNEGYVEPSPDRKDVTVAATSLGKRGYVEPSPETHLSGSRSVCVRDDTSLVSGDILGDGWSSGSFVNRAIRDLGADGYMTTTTITAMALDWEQSMSSLGMAENFGGSLGSLPDTGVVDAAAALESLSNNAPHYEESSKYCKGNTRRYIQL